VRLATNFFVLLLIANSAGRAQQSESKLSNSMNSVSCKFSDGKTLTSEYPARIFDNVAAKMVTYGKIWPQNADRITFVTDTDLSIAGHDVPAGSYFLFAIPTADKWIFVLTKSKNAPDVTRSTTNDFLRVNMLVSARQTPTENLVMDYARKGDSCTLKIAWQKTEASIEVVEKKLCWPLTTPLTYQCPDQ